MSDLYMIITGASRGIGLATGELFLEKGYKVINLSRTEPAVADFTHIPTDLSDKESLTKARFAIQAYVKPESEVVLIHNACNASVSSTFDTEYEEAQQALQISLLAPMMLNKSARPYMAKGSSILYVGSTLSEQAVPDACSYVVSKHGVVGLMRSTAQDLAGTGIHSACICPGFTDTEMLYEHMNTSKDDLNFIKPIQNKVLLKRLLKSEEIAELLYFTAKSPSLNGSVIHANLGQVGS